MSWLAWLKNQKRSGADATKAPVVAFVAPVPGHSENSRLHSAADEAVNLPVPQSAPIARIGTRRPREEKSEGGWHRRYERYEPTNAPVVAFVAPRSGVF